MTHQSKRKAQGQSEAYKCRALSDSEKQKFEKHLRDHKVINERYTPPIFPAVIGLRRDILSKASDIARSFQNACRAAWMHAQKNEFFVEQLFRPFAAYPFVRKTAMEYSFHMEFFRIDFYLDPGTEELHIIEVNASPGALPEHECMDQFLGTLVETSPLPNTEKLKPEAVIGAFLDYVEKQTKKRPHSFGLIARDNNRDFCYAEAVLYADVVKKLGAEPVFCAVDRTKLSMFPTLNVQPASLDALDTLYHNPSGTLADRQQISEWLESKSIVLMPPRMNLLFTNKSFLTLLLSNLDALDDLGTNDKELLRSALLPSFALQDLEKHEHLLEEWEGVALKRDVGSSGSYVEIIPFDAGTKNEAIAKLRMLRDTYAKSQETWTVQALARHSFVEVNGSKFGFDVMVYALLNETSSLLYSSRPFVGNKANISQGASYGQIFSF